MKLWNSRFYQTGAFEPFLRAYYENFKYQSIDSYQFKEFFLNYFNSNDLSSIDWEQWFNLPGMPKYKPNFDESLAKVSSVTWAISQGSKMAFYWISKYFFWTNFLWIRRFAVNWEKTGSNGLKVNHVLLQVVIWKTFRQGRKSSFLVNFWKKILSGTILWQN